MSLLQNISKLSNAGFLSLKNRCPCALSFGYNVLFDQKRFAARKGKRIEKTREKQRLARLRREELKNAPPKVWKPHKLLIDKSLKAISKKFKEDDRKELTEIVDDVYVIDLYKERKYDIEQALNMLRETHDPTMYDEPDALVQAKIELDLRTKKKTKFVERFNGIVSYQNLFEYGAKRKIVAICKTEDDEKAAKLAGAEIAGSSEIIRMLKVGDISLENFDDLVCHGDMLIELASIKNVVGLYFPTKQRGNIGFDMSRLVRYFVNGLEYKLNKDDYEPDYGWIEMPFGKLNQSDFELEENFKKFLEVIDSNRPIGAPGKFITRVTISSSPSPEKFAISFWNLIEGYENLNPMMNEGNDESKVNAVTAN